MSKKILLIFTNHSVLGTSGKQTGWYLPEGAHPYHVFKANGFAMDFASPLGGKAPMDEGSGVAFKDDPVCIEFLKDADAQAKLENTLAVKDLNPQDYAAVLYVGGHGPMWDLAGEKNVGKFSAQIYENGGLVSAVCHGVAGLLPIEINGKPLVQGKQVTSFTNAEEDAVGLSQYMPFMLETALINQGANFVKADLWQAQVASQDRVFTGQNPASATPLAEAIVKHLKQ